MIPGHAFNNVTELNGARIDKGRPVFVRFEVVPGGRVIIAKAFKIDAPAKIVDGVALPRRTFYSGVEVTSLPDGAAVPALIAHTPAGQHMTLLTINGAPGVIQTNTRLQ